ncbi:hypothetical protein A3A64_04665 [Candidatus Gottesmanbacteria bacterium RIFCSPLOWO2_01_FULL_48_11]|uniref:Uncharacterized protein n=3 Tax=Candidatus Gottesmaniibacteriota TaxID=1752720 RepID=A0A0G1X070_9BACT|nr:MAG: hypothetical protein UY16_C0014G0011 [Candidatus Gottesmanbacteria bacterium GW2011_GWA2_47_9]KKU95963.1 MAG: hypothetical protein UY27_C0006G0011 [Candidatus Gottesmanbacteria bacterium GW2011_GWA1_48_13]OGG27801.1 MAG: hypothetical protein A3A64_04665 [Candidatus Gottesmanbacteria bacterium RIFCSPLOWO2_01_FULL_48_11]
MSLFTKVFAQTADPAELFGTVQNPLQTAEGRGYPGLAEGGLTLLFSNVLRLIFVAAGIYALVNFIMAGFQYMNAGGDSKAMTAAWDRIWQSLLGLIIIVGSFALAALFGYLIFGNANYILNPTIYGPAQAPK